MFYFSWVEADEVFDPKIHGRWDEDVFSFSLQQKKNELPFARITLKSLADLKKTFFFFSHRDQEKISCVFRGRINKAPESLENGLVQLEGGIDDPRYNEILTHFKNSPFYDPLIVGDSITFEKCKKFFPWEVTWDPITHHPRFYFLEDRSTAKEWKDFFPSTFNLKKTKDVVARLGVKLTAQWVQEDQGIRNISPWIHRSFPEGLISTYTPENLKEAWPKSGKKIKNTGYWIAYSHLQEVSRKKGKSLFNSKLLLGWSYRQRRKENISFTLNSNLPGIQKDIHFALPRILPVNELYYWKPDTAYKIGTKIQWQGFVYKALQNHTSGKTFLKDVDHFWQRERALDDKGFSLLSPSFFHTERGKKLLNIWIMIAKKEMIREAHCLTLSFETSLENFSHLKIGDCLVIEGKRGVIKAIYYDVSPMEKRLRVELECSLGAKFLPDIKKTSGDIYANDYMEISDSEDFYDPFDDQYPKGGLLFPLSLHRGKVINQCHIFWPANNQNKVIKERGTLKSDEATSLAIDLIDLRSCDCLEHSIFLECHDPVQTPIDIDIGDI